MIALLAGIVPVLVAWVVVEAVRLVRSHRELGRIARSRVDERTGLLDARGVTLVLGPELELARMQGVSIACCMFEFRGGGVADAMRCIARVRRLHEHAIRLDDFRVVVLLWDVTPLAAATAVDRIAQGFVAPLLDVRCGVAIAPGDGDRSEDLLRIAGSNLRPVHEYRDLDAASVDLLGLGDQVTWSMLERVRLALIAAPSNLGLATCAAWIGGAGAVAALRILDANSWLQEATAAMALLALLLAIGRDAASLRELPIPACLLGWATLVGVAVAIGPSWWTSAPLAAGASLLGIVLARLMFVRLWWAAVGAVVMSVVDIWSVLGESGITRALVESEHGLAASLMVNGPQTDSGLAAGVGIADVTAIAMFCCTAALWSRPVRPVLVAMATAAIAAMGVAVAFDVGLPLLPFLGVAFLLAMGRDILRDIRRDLPR